jgi:hypothetical protein
MDLTFLEKPYVFGALALLLILYGSAVGPELPPFMKNLFQHPVFQILIFSLIVYRGNKNPQTALIIAVAFLFIMTVVERTETREEFRKIEAFQQMATQQSTN